jgi:hypothetical protein
MANSATTQVILDGPRHTVIKFEGILDTSDIAAAGTLGTVGVTTSASNIISFTAGALAPLVGQYVTAASGTGTGLPANTYITAIISTTSVALNNNVTTGGTGWTFTLVAGAVVVADPALLAAIDNATKTPAGHFGIERIDINIEDLLSINLFWEATANVRIEELVGRGKMDYIKYGNVNSSTLYGGFPAGATGRIVATSQGWSASAILSFSVTIKLIKQI